MPRRKGDNAYLLFMRATAFTTITNDVIIPDIKENRIIVANVVYAMYINTLVCSQWQVCK